MSNDVQFDIKGFSPDQEIRKLISAVAEKLHFSSPSDSVMRMALGKSKDVIRGSIRIVSQAGVFVTDVISDDPIRAIHQMENKIREQLEAWKAKRFD